ncbi:ERV/ALR sulfhydryl oxidase domain-containing protein [Yarrowia lipolytica]|nr:ERV/ALR sulfhydryl oxidase domain-containing protein [Yarrowia lipolytica]RDW39201.1 ERV/ALR sulfhydryl oxidase domain-containing protein [Yarrowia lipolytica]RDW42992.1 ERV/ALR sulfhydryl oxidase domain-containing protein [Yarrowia lipolytica]RDW49723.1 ERV/ALR sulfhydryl oxidase domain-containing protein [Yarrowia lipolytica]
MIRRSSATFIALILTLVIITVVSLRSDHVPGRAAVSMVEDRITRVQPGSKKAAAPEKVNIVKDDTSSENIKAKNEAAQQVPDIGGPSIMAKMGNETLKAELGRASWKLFHTIMAQYPETPTKQEQTTLKNYIYLFSQVYPCGECAEHFQKLLAKFPPQVSSRNTASQWACYVHNQVNERLGKEIFDCNNVGEHYKCGCAEDEEGGEKKEEDSDIMEPMEDDFTFGLKLDENE